MHEVQLSSLKYDIFDTFEQVDNHQFINNIFQDCFFMKGIEKLCVKQNVAT